MIIAELPGVRYHIPTPVSLLVIALVLAGSIGVSLYRSPAPDRELDPARVPED
ncbi:MAG: hypothetical protein R2705_24675 [Ilumatobacteraceae bacterium]